VSTEVEATLVWPNGQLVDVASIEGYADEARVLAMSVLEDGEVRTPDWVIAELAAVSAHAARMVLVILNAETLKRQAATKLARAKAEARVKHQALPAALATARIVLDTAAAQDEYDVAVAAFEYARRIGNLLKDYTGRVQSIGRQVELTYSLGPGRVR
jgi:hypothetical protein